MKTKLLVRTILAFAITATIFGTAFYVSNYFNARRVEAIRTMQDNMAVDILSLETQFQLLQELSCRDIRENSVLSNELVSLQNRLAYTERQLGTENEEVLRLKRQYSLLQIKDMLLMKRVSEKCGLQPVFILYFYSNETADKNPVCADCEKQGYVLTALAEKYPSLRVYSFDYSLDLPALKTLININDVPAQLPALVINEKVYNGFKSVEDVETLLPELKKLDTSSKAKVEEKKK
jgi:hypothetical protein